MSIDAKRRVASAAFLALLALSVFWPAPVIAINDACCHAALRVDNLSFLGREAPSWDVAFWCLAGLLLLAIVLSAPFTWSGLWRGTFGQGRAAPVRRGGGQEPRVVAGGPPPPASRRWAGAAAPAPAVSPPTPPQ